jgi:hypothetical protein
MRCDTCSSPGPAAPAEFRHNVGMLLMRREYATVGDFCRACLGRAFRHHTLRNVTLGWWGALSFVMTWVFLVANVASYLRALGALGTRRAPVTSLPEVLSGEAALRRLARFEHNVRLRLREGEDVQALASDLARVHGVTRASAEHFVEGVAQADSSAA